MSFYRIVSLGLAFIFATVGMLFMLLPDRVIGFFNAVSSPLGMPGSPAAGFNFFLILAAAYMYIVSVLAFMMYRSPNSVYFPFLLAHAKLASSVLSLGMFILTSKCLIYLTNFIVDGLIGVLVLGFYFKIRRSLACASS